MSEFLTRNKPDWEELEALVARARKRIRRMTPEELARLDVLYRRTTVHLAQVATRTQSANLVKYLNDLTAAAHSVIYLPPRKAALAGAAQFLTEGFARAVARTWRYQLASALLMIGGAVAAYLAASHDVQVAYALQMPRDERSPGSTPEQLRAFLKSGREMGSASKFEFASRLLGNNLRVAIFSLALGALAGIPTIFLIIYNGMILGAFTAMHHRAGIYEDYWAWILPHGVSELSAIVLCGGVGLMLGRAVLSPGTLTRLESLKRAGNEAVAISMGAAIMLVLAAIVESYLRQSYLSNSWRFAFAGATAIFWAAYFVHGAIRERAAQAQATTDDDPMSALLDRAQAADRAAVAIPALSGGSR
jgi:uncharacterized membrane protein SpoIIM required for sporulation